MQDSLFHLHFSMFLFLCNRSRKKLVLHKAAPVQDPEVCDPIRFLRAREIVHFQRFGEGLRMVQDELDSNNFYMCNPEFDPGCVNMENQTR